MKFSISLHNGSRTFITLLCTLAFLFNSSKILKNFFEGSKVVSQHIEQTASLHLPSITVCNRNPYKRPITKLVDLELKKYLENTMNLDEILIKPFIIVETNGVSKNTSDQKFTAISDLSLPGSPVSITPTYTYYNGRCYTIDTKNKVSAILNNFIVEYNGLYQLTLM